jgi:hypothetical protein
MPTILNEKGDHMRRLLACLALLLLPGLGAAQTYDVVFNGFRIDNTRSRHEDTLYASLSLKVGATQYPSQTKFLGNKNNGTFPVGLVFSNVAIPADSTSVTIVWSMVNNGHGDSAAIQNALGSAADGVIRGSGQDATANFISSLIQAGLGVFFANCDGLVAAGKYSVTGADLAGMTRSAEKSLSTDHPGTDSPSGCGSNSRYNTHIRIVRK